MLHAGLDLSRKRLDVCLLGDDGEHLDQLAIPPDVASLRKLARRIDEVHRQPVCAVVESMTGARIVHDTLEAEGAPNRFRCEVSWLHGDRRFAGIVSVSVAAEGEVKIEIKVRQVGSV